MDVRGGSWTDHIRSKHVSTADSRFFVMFMLSSGESWRILCTNVFLVRLEEAGDQERQSRIFKWTIVSILMHRNFQLYVHLTEKSTSKEVESVIRRNFQLYVDLTEKLTSKEVESVNNRLFVSFIFVSCCFFLHFLSKFHKNYCQCKNKTYSAIGKSCGQFFWNAIWTIPNPTRNYYKELTKS